MSLSLGVILTGIWTAVTADPNHCPELRSLLENEANWYQSKKYCESQGLTLSEVEPGDGPDGILADYYRRSNPGRQWHGGPVIMAPECTKEGNFTCRRLNCTMLTGGSLINVSCSEKAQAACQFIYPQENKPEPYPFRLVRNPRSRADAETYCSYFDMTLVVIPDENKQRLLLEYLLLEETTAEELLLGDYYMGLDDQGWIDGSPVTWSNFVENPSVGTKGVFRVSEVTKWDWNDGIEQLKFICEKRPPPSLRFGLAVWTVDGPEADQQECTATDSPPVYWYYQSTKPVFLLDDNWTLFMYHGVKKLGMKYEFRIWMNPTVVNVHIFRIRITTWGESVSCNAPQTLVYTEAKPIHAGCCGKQIQCRHDGDVEKRDYGYLKSCIYKCECVDARCQCSHLVIRFYYVPWFGGSQLSGQFNHLMGIS